MNGDALSCAFSMVLREEWTVLRRARQVPVTYLIANTRCLAAEGLRRRTRDSSLERFTRLSSPATPISSRAPPPCPLMDPIANRDTLFSRGPSPPPQQPQHFQAASTQLADGNVSAPQTVREANNTAAQSALDSLFHNLSAAQPPQVGPQPATLPTNIHAGPQDVPHSGPATPASVNAGSVSSSHSGPSNTTADRQNALLSLLGAVTSPPSSSTQIPPMIGPMPQQVPTPPGSAPRIGQSSNEQTKFLLDQLMSG